MSAGALASGASFSDASSLSTPDFVSGSLTGWASTGVDGSSASAVIDAEVDAAWVLAGGFFLGFFFFFDF